MRVTVISENIAKLVKDLMVKTYGISEKIANDIVFDINQIIIENEDD
jgi:hypothetical protein